MAQTGKQSSVSIADDSRTAPPTSAYRFHSLFPATCRRRGLRCDDIISIFYQSNTMVCIELKNKGYSRAEQSRAEQSRAEQSRAEQSRAEQSRAEQRRTEQSREEQRRTEQSRAEQSRAEQNREEQGQVILMDRRHCQCFGWYGNLFGRLRRSNYSIGECGGNCVLTTYHVWVGIP